MELRVYKTFDDPRVVHKVYTPLFSTQCAVYYPCDILTPELIIEYNPLIYNANAFEVPIWHRTYFLGDVILTSGNRMILPGSVDVCETYWQEIKALNATVIRNEVVTNSGLIDNSATFSPRRTISIRQFQTSPFNTRDMGNGNNFVLVVAGGHVSG